MHESFTCQDVCNGEAPAEPLSGAAYTASLNSPAADAPVADAADATGAGASAAPANAEAEAFEGGGGEPPAVGAATAISAETAAGGDAYDADGNYVGGGAAGDGYVPPEEDAEDNPYLAHGEDGDGTDEPPDDYPVDPDDIPPPDDYTPPDEDDYGGREYDDDYSRYHDDDDYGAGAEYDTTARRTRSEEMNAKEDDETLGQHPQQPLRALHLEHARAIRPNLAAVLEQLEEQRRAFTHA